MCCCLNHHHKFDFFQRIVTSKMISFKSQPLLPAIPMVRDHLRDNYRHFLFFNTQKVPDIKGFQRKISGDGTGSHTFISIEKDRFLLTSIVKFFKALCDAFINQQVHAIIRYILKSMDRAQTTQAFFHGPSHLEPIIILNLLNSSEGIRNEPNAFRRNAYLKTVFNTIVDWLNFNYPH